MAGVSLDEMGAIGHAPGHAPTQSGLTLGKNVSQVWGKKPEPTPVPAAPSPQTVPSPVEQPAQVQPTAVDLPRQAATPEPEAPRAPTEKEKMAAALFGGFGGGAAAKAPQRRVSQATQKPTTYAAPSPPPVVKPVSSPNTDDLLDMLSPDQPDPAPSSVHKSSSNDLDLLADMGVSEPTPHPAPPTTASVFDAFDGLLAPTAVSQPTAAGAGGGMSEMATHNSVLRPLQLRTSEFGSRWSNTPCEAKQGTACRVRNLVELRGILENHHGTPFIGHVESIQNTNEVIL